MSDAITPPAPQRPDPPRDGDERTTLRLMLDHHRVTMLQKVAGLSAEQLAMSIPPSTMTLGGLLKHLTYVENWWFVQITAGLPAVEPWASVDWDADPDWEWRTAADDDPAELAAAYLDACEQSRSIEAARELDELSERWRGDRRVSLRWVLLHMIEETARHNGHADLIREVVDGTTGY